MLFWEGGREHALISFRSSSLELKLHRQQGNSTTQKMKLSTSLLLPTLVGAAAALSDANVYIFQRDSLPATSNPPTLTPEQARLVFAQRLGTSRYHGLGDASESTLSYIKSFGGPERSLFEDAADDRPSELVLIVEGVSSKSGKQEPLIAAYSGIKPAFTISKAPSMTANKQLASDLNKQCGSGKKSCAVVDAINPFDVSCWNGKSKVIHFDLAREKVRSFQSEYPANANRSTAWYRAIDIGPGEIDSLCREWGDECSCGPDAGVITIVQEPSKPVWKIRKGLTESNRSETRS